MQVSSSKGLLSVIPPAWARDIFAMALVRVNSPRDIHNSGVLIANAVFTKFGGSLRSVNYVEVVRDSLELDGATILGCIPTPVDVDIREETKIREIVEQTNAFPLKALHLSEELAKELPDLQYVLYDYAYLEAFGVDTVEISKYVMVAKEPLQLLKTLLESVSQLFREMVPGASSYVIKMLELTYAVYLFGAVFGTRFGYWPQVLLKCKDQASCDVLLELFARGLPYATDLVMSPKDLARNRLLFTTYVLKSSILDKLSNGALRLVFTNDSIHCGEVMPGGVAVLATHTPQLEESVCKVRPLLCKERPPAILYIDGDVQKPKELGPLEFDFPNGERWHFENISELRETEVALFLMLAYDIGKVFHMVGRAIERGEKTYWSSIPSNIVNAYWHHIVMAELLGREYKEALAQYIRTYGNKSVLARI